MSLRYLIATNPRSGSGFLCDLLHKTGVAGMRPLTGISGWEYLGTHMNDAAGRSPLELLDEGFRRSEVGGAFGFKVMWPDLAALRARCVDRDERRALQEELKRCPWIRLRRRDQLALAVSWAKAVQNNQWNSNKEPLSTRLQYNYLLIARRLGEARRNEQAWDRWFAEVGIEPLDLFYEDYVLDPSGTLRNIGAHLDRDGQLQCRLEQTNYKVQRDATNSNWIERFERDQRSAGTRWMAIARSLLARSTWRELVRRVPSIPLLRRRESMRGATRP